jgi:hypothetical protein
MVVAGTVWGQQRQRYDLLFAIPEVAELLDQEFICVRVDTLMEPSWRSLLSPQVRQVTGQMDDFFVGFFNSEGELLAVPNRDEIRGMSDTGLLVFLRQVLNQFVRGAPGNVHEESLRAARELRGGVSSSIPDLGVYRDTVQDRMLRRQGFDPFEMEFLLDVNENDSVKSSVMAILGSPQYDAVRGGVFDRMIGGEVEFVKSGFRNSAFLTVLARLSVFGDENLRWAARRQFDFVERQFAASDSPAYYFSATKEAQRSDFYSYSPRRLSEVLTPAERDVAVKQLGLDVRRNPQALPYFVNLDRLGDADPVRDEVIARLASVDSEERLGGKRLSFESQAYAVAQLLRSARFLGDQGRVDRALILADDLRTRMRVGLDDVMAGPPTELTEDPGLGSYVAFADVCWEAMLAGGGATWGDDGARVLNRGLFLYRDEGNSLWSGRLEDFDELWRALMPPPVSDSGMPSAVARLIRLCYLYAAWPDSAGLRGGFIRARDRAFSQSGWLLSTPVEGCGSLARSVQVMLRDKLVGVGSDCDWVSWEREFPGLLFVPLGEAGVRIYSGGEWRGPYSEVEARSLFR